MTDTASLQIRVTSSGIEDADRKLSRLERQGQRTERATDGLGRAFTRLAVPTVAATAAVAAATIAMVRHSAAQAKEMKNLARLANTGFEAFQGYAYATEQVGVSAEKLADISKDVQDKLGDFIATGGGAFKDFFENVAPKVGLTAQALQGLSGPDVLVAVKKAMDDANVSAEEQTFYLEALASDATLLTPLLKDNGAAMRAQAEEAERLGGVLSKIDSQKLLEASEASRKFDIALGGLIKRFSAYLAPAVTEATGLATDAIVRMSDALVSGEIESYLDAIAGKFDGWGEDIATTMNIVGQLVQGHFGQWGSEADSAVDSVIDVFKDLPENVRATVQLMAVEFAALIDYGKAYGKAFGQVIGVELAALVDKAGIYGKELVDRLNPFDGDTFDYEAELARSTATTSEITDSYFREAKRQAGVTRQARIASIEAVLLERDSAVDSFDKQIAGAKDLRSEYERLQAERKKATEGRNAPAKSAARPRGRSTGETDKATKRLQDKQKQEFDNLVASLRTEEEAIQDSYDRRLQIILQNTEEGSRQQQDLVNRLNQDFATQVLEGFQAEPATFDAKEAALQEEYERRREIILDNTRLTEEQRTELELQLTQERNEQLATLEAQKNQQMLSNASQIFDGLAGIAKSASGEQSDAYRALFAVSKAFSVTQAAMSIATGLAKAQELGFPANLAEMARVTASGASILATIRGSNFSGAYDHGGMIPAGKIGIVGEYGPELISGPATVTSRRTTADSPNQSGNSQPQTPTPPQNNIRIINSIDPGVMDEYLGSSGGEKIILNVIKRNGNALRGVLA